MVEKKERTNCKADGCKLLGVYYQDLPDGTTILCVNAVHNGRKHVRTFKMPEGVKRLEII